MPKNIALFILVTVILCFSFPVRVRAADVDAFVTRQGTKFYLSGNEFKFVGFNLFDAAGSGTSPYSCVETNGWFAKMTDKELDTAMKEMKSKTGASVLRFWAFQKYTKGGTDWSGMDKVLRLAKENGLKVLPVLDDGPGYCTEPGGGGNNHMEKWKYQSDTWYTAGYKTVTAPYTISYRDYVKAIVTKYKDEPTILGWMMMNEADTSKQVVNAQGKAQAATIGFANDIGPLIKSIDTKHLLTVGTQSNGASGGSGQDFIDLYGLSFIDFSEAHDWGYWGNDQEAIPGGIKNADGTMSLPNPTSTECLKQYQSKVGCSLAQSIQIIQKPIVMGESGIAAVTETERQTRAVLMDKKMKAFFDNGGAGYVYWQWNKVLDSQHYDALQGSNDPLFPIMKKYAGYQFEGTNIGSAPVDPTLPGTVSNQDFVRGLNLFGGWQGEYGGVDAFATPEMMEYFKNKGFTHFRAGFSWKHLQPTLNGPLDPTYLAKMDALMTSARDRGLKIAWVPLPGSYGQQQINTSAVPLSAFYDMWVKVAVHYKNESALWGYDLLNEPNMGDIWNTQIAPAAIAAIRTVDVKNTIIVPTSTGGYGHNWKFHLAGLPMSDPNNNLIYQAHFYFDNPPDGRYLNGFDVPNANLNIGVDNARDFVEWCVSNNVRCLAGEYGVPQGWKWGDQTCLYDGGTNKDPRWLTVLDNFLTYLDQNKISGMYWSGGPYGDVSSIGPFCDANKAFYDAPQMPILTKHLGSNVTAVPTATPTTCNEDINQDHIVDLSDYSILVRDFLKSTPTNPRSNIDRLGEVDLTDYSLLVRKFLKSC